VKNFGLIETSTKIENFGLGKGERLSPDLIDPVKLIVKGAAVAQRKSERK
jgi:hypothetical protein